MTEHVVIAGATGVVGYSALRHFARRGDCAVTGLSRRAPLETPGARLRSVDLTDRAACQTLAAELRDATQLVFSALYEKPGLYTGWLEADQIDTNRRMFENLLDSLDAAAPRLRHVTLLQGTKAYGAHVRPIPLPAREDRDEARDVANFYWEQEDHLRARQSGRAWGFTILRPQIVFGISLGSAMNLIPALGVYAALRRERGEPLAYPGGEGSVIEAVDADLLARAIAWAAESPQARNQIFNVTNGDVFTWANVWPAIADALGMKLGPPEPQRLGESMPARAQEWDAIRAKYGLRSPGLHEFVGESFHYADFVMAYGAQFRTPPAIVSTVKLRQAGFGEVMDTEAMFRKWFALLREQRLLP
ncbi:MAG TPA: SDR family oxidoreductase [Myxococcota bacterium]|nr:SDR family oxidoreductase [Myxococcota bacterium]